MQNQRVFVLDTNKNPLMPCHPARARKLLRSGRASVFRKQPFTIIVHNRVGGETQDTELRVDPGSKTTGCALVVSGQNGDRAVAGVEVGHRSYDIEKTLKKRRGVRGNRRSRKTRYRAPRFKNRSRPGGMAPTKPAKPGGACTDLGKPFLQICPGIEYCRRDSSF